MSKNKKLEFPKRLELLGLTWKDLDIHAITSVEQMALGLSSSDGLIVPYRDMHGQLTDFYVGKVNTTAGPKSVQQTKTANQVYFPKSFSEAFKESSQVLFCTCEAEAAYLSQRGIATCAYRPLYGWRNSGIRIPAESTVLPSIYKENSQEFLDVELPPNMDAVEILISLATGIDHLLNRLEGRKIVLYGPKLVEGQESLASFYWELQNSGGIKFKDIKQYIPQKSLLRDILEVPQLTELLLDFKNLPAIKHPNMKKYLSRQLTSYRLKRKLGMKYGMYIVSDLWSKGTSYITESGEMFYFHHESKNLMRINWGRRQEQASLHETEFGRFIFREYGINANDAQILTNVSAFSTEDESLEAIAPRRVLHIMEREDIQGTSIYYQISDSAFLDIQASRISVLDNGENNVMFVKGQIEPIDPPELEEEIKVQRMSQSECWWEHIVNGLNVVQTTEEVPVEYTKRLYSLLPYISPWFLKWNRTQLPIEIVTGEAGSGKSSLLELRQMILTGYTKLRNSPSDIRDWYAGVSSAGGVYTMDNVQFTNKQLRQRLSDEICQLSNIPI